MLRCAPGCEVRSWGKKMTSRVGANFIWPLSSCDQLTTFAWNRVGVAPSLRRLMMAFFCAFVSSTRTGVTSSPAAGTDPAQSIAPTKALASWIGVRTVSVLPLLEVQRRRDGRGVRAGGDVLPERDAAVNIDRLGAAGGRRNRHAASGPRDRAAGIAVELVGEGVTRGRARHDSRTDRAAESDVCVRDALGAGHREGARAVGVVGRSV